MFLTGELRSICHKWLKNIWSVFYRRALCTFGCCWLWPALFDGASFVSGMCNLPSRCLRLHAEKAFLVLCLPGNPSDSCVSPASRTTLTYSCPTGCSETDWHARASEGSRALPLLPPSLQLAGSSRGRWAMEIRPLGTRQQLWAAYCEI